MFYGQLFKTAEEDVYADGCIGNLQDFGLITDFTEKTISELIKKVLYFVGGDRDCMEYDDYNNEIRFSVMEDSEASVATDSQIERWKKGNCRLWIADYFLQVQELTEVKENILSEAVKNFNSEVTK